MFDFVDRLQEIVIKTIVAIFEALMSPFERLDSLQTLINNGGNQSNMVWGVFPMDVFNYALNPIMTISYTLAFILLAALIVIWGVRFAMRSSSPQGYIEFWQNGLKLFLIGVVLFNLPTLYDLLFQLNSVLINAFSTALDMSKEVEAQADDQTLGNLLGKVLVQLVLVGLAIWANFFYLMRMTTLTILLGLGPIFVVMYMNPQLTPVAKNWLKETISTVYVQSIHALVYWLLTIISLTQPTVIGAVITLVIFIPTTVMVRHLFMLGGTMQDNLHRAGAAFGMTSLFAMAGAVKGAMNGKSFSEVAKSAVTGVKDAVANKSIQPMGDAKDTIGGNEVSDVASDKKAERMLKNGEILKSIGKGTFGIMGAIGGAGLGPTGVFAGTAIASTLGGEVSGLAGRVGTGMYQHTIGRKKDVASDRLSPSVEQDVEQAAEALAEQEAHAWTQANQQELRDDLKSRFPDATNADIDKLLEAETMTRKAMLKERFIDELSHAIEYGENHLPKTSDTAHHLAAQMSERWGNQHEDEHRSQFEAAHPQQANETNEAYEQRIAQDLDAKKQAVYQRLLPIAEQALQASTNTVGDVNRAAFAQNVANKLNNLDEQNQGLGFADNAEDSYLAAQQLEGKSIVTPEGRLATTNVGQYLAQQATQQAKDEYIQNELARGNTLDNALTSWNKNHAPVISAANEAQYAHVDETLQQARQLDDETKQAFIKPSFLERMKQLPSSIATGAMIRSERVGDILNDFKAGAITNGEEMFNQSRESGKGFLRSSAAALGSGVKGAFHNLAETHADSVGSFAEAENEYINKTGYFGGMLLGNTGSVMARKLAHKLSPYASGVQGENHTATEIAQMAQSTTDALGNKTPLQGAIRQVITNDGSFVEVLNRSGERERVSRIGGGHAGLKDGEAVYQDLSFKDGMLVPTKRGDAMTYRQTDDGSIVPSDVKISGDANALLRATPRVATTSGLNYRNFDMNDIAQLAKTETMPVATSKISEGAMRQVVTNEGSFIEVLSQSGEVKRIAGTTEGAIPHLRDTDAVYRDLKIDSNGQLIPVQRNGHDTYTMTDSGKIVPTTQQVTQSPQQILETSPNLAAITQTGGSYRQVVTNNGTTLEHVSDKGEIKTISSTTSGAMPHLADGEIIQRPLAFNGSRLVEATGNGQQVVRVSENGSTVVENARFDVNPNHLLKDAYQPASINDIQSMAHKTTTQQLMKQDGVIRQVIADGQTHLEVVQANGNVQRVSPIQTLSEDVTIPGQTLYREYKMENQTLVPTTGQVYSVGSNGTKIPENVEIPVDAAALVQPKRTISPIVRQPLVETSVTEAYTPQEVTNIAARDTDGNTIKGSVRQVVTKDESYIEVQTQQGGRVRVSHVGKGNAALMDGDAVYQDLTVRDNEYVPATFIHNGKRATTYRVNSNGERTAANVIVEDANQLHSVSNAIRATQQAAPSVQTIVRGKEFPSFNQMVDVGEFYTEDVQASGIENIRLIVENNRQYLVGNKGEATYRISPISTGDTRLGSNEVREIPIQVTGTRLQPTMPVSEHVAMGQQHVQEYPNEAPTRSDMDYAATAIRNLMVSRTLMQAMNVNKTRQTLNEVRQKQTIF